MILRNRIKSEGKTKRYKMAKMLMMMIITDKDLSLGGKE